MPRQGQKGKKKKSWNQKKKEPGVARKSNNKGLPREFIEQYGEVVERRLISKQTWDEFYKTGEGKARATDLMARADTRNAEINGYLNDKTPVVAQRNDATVQQIVKMNAIAKANARQRKGGNPAGRQAPPNIQQAPPEGPANL